MAYDVIHKNSTVAGTPPTAAEVELGEIAINAADAELYVKDANGNIRKFQNTTTGTANGVNFTQSGAGAVARTVESKLKDVVSVKDFGAVGDGATNDTAAIQAALTASRRVTVPAGTYRLTSTVTLTQFGHSLIGVGGKNTTVLLIDHTSGPGVTLAQGQCQLENLTITASDTRQTFSAGATYGLAPDLFGVKLYNAAGYLTQCKLSRLSISRHPNHGVYMGGEGAGTSLFQCESYGNRGHGYAFDDRTIGGGTSQRCGIVEVSMCRASDNGGNALHLSQNGSTCYRFTVLQLETLNNAWNTAISGLNNAEVYIGGENHTLKQSAFYDGNGDTKVTTSLGDSRLAKTGNLSAGIYIRSFSSNIFLENLRFISCYRGVVAGTSVQNLSATGAYFTQQIKSGGSINVYRGFDIGDNVEQLKIDILPSSAVTTMVTSNAYEDYPLVVNKKKASGITSITATGAYEPIPGISGTVFLAPGRYRFLVQATVQNGSTAGSNFSLGVRLTKDSDPSALVNIGDYKSINANYFEGLSLTFVHEITDAGLYLIEPVIRQATGNLGSILDSNNTFGKTSLQVEKLTLAA